MLSHALPALHRVSSLRLPARAAARLPLRLKPRRAVAMASAAAPAAPAGVKADYAALCERLKEVSALSGVSGLLGWDEQVMMPPGAAELRARQGAALAGVIYEKETDAALGALLTRLAAADLGAAGLDAYEVANVREASKAYRRRVALSKELAQREARLSSEGYQAWVAARKASDYSQFAPVLSQWLALTREKCAAIAPGAPLYDTALEPFEKGMTSARLDAVFSELRDGLVPLLADVKARGKPPDDSWLRGDFDVDKQAALCREIALQIGFDIERGRLDVSVHPFTGGAGPSDVRMTTRFKANDLTEGLTGAIHETGHALYEQGRLGGAHDGLPVSDALSMGVHESQSLLWERCVALSPAFATFLLPKLREAFPQLPAGRTADDLYAALNRVSTRSAVRVEADELNYPLHIVMRYELEAGLLRGDISVEELPTLWNQKMREYLGVNVENDAEGVLQDVHWSAGAIGYFPVRLAASQTRAAASQLVSDSLLASLRRQSYTLGAMMAVQIFNAAKRDLPTLDADIAAGRFGGLKGWLNTRVHALGSLHGDADALMTAATGEPLRPAHFLQYLREKYSKIYKL